MITRVDQNTLSALQTATGITFVLATAVALPIIFAIGSPSLAAAFATVGIGSLATFAIVTYLRPKHKRLPPLPSLPRWRRPTVSGASLNKPGLISLAKAAPKWPEALGQVNTLLGTIEQQKLRKLLQMTADNLPSVPDLTLPPLGKETVLSGYLYLGFSQLELTSYSLSSPLASVLMPVLERRHEAGFKELCSEAAMEIQKLLEGNKSKTQLIEGIKNICTVA